MKVMISLPMNGRSDDEVRARMSYLKKEFDKLHIDVVDSFITDEIEGSNYPQGEFEWAKDFVYGIEKDYMLVKTTKISTFLNGDGDANIIHADGLDNFYSDKKYP